MYMRDFLKLRGVFIFLVICFFALSGFCEILHLGADQKWRNVSEEAQGGYLMAISQIKEQIDTGQVKAAQQSVAAFKEQFPEFSGPELDGFMSGEVLYAEGKWVKAVHKYDEFLDTWPESKLFESVLERQYSVAIGFLNGEKRRVMKILKLNGYDEAEKIMHRIAELTGDAPIAKRGLVAIAESLEERKKFLDAYEAWSDVATRWATGEMGQIALLGMARSLHSAYHGPDFDASSLASAQSYYENFRLRYPDAAVEYDIDGKIKMIDEQLAYKEFMTGEYYYQTSSMTAADLYYRRVIEKWPESSAAKMATGKLEMIDSAQQTGIKAEPEKDPIRKVFDGGMRLLDSWFGLEKMFVREQE